MIVYPERRFGKAWANNWGSNRKFICTMQVFDWQTMNINCNMCIYLYNNDYYICIYTHFFLCIGYNVYKYMYIYRHLGVANCTSMIFPVLVSDLKFSLDVFHDHFHDPGGGQLHCATSAHWAFLRLCPSVYIKYLWNSLHLSCCESLHIWICDFGDEFVWRMGDFFPSRPQAPENIQSDADCKISEL